MQQPYILQERKDFLNCFQSVLSCFLVNNKLSYHWGLSDSWTFYYRSPNAFSPTLDGFIDHSPFYYNMSTIYNSQVSKTEGQELRGLIRHTTLENKASWVFAMVDGWYIPWHPYYQKTHGHHFLLIVDVNPLNDRAFVMDTWPNRYCGWYSISGLIEAYESEAKRCYSFTVPYHQPGSDLLVSQLTKCYGHMVGEEKSEYASGIAGLKRFKQDLELLGDEGEQFLDVWWDLWKVVIDTKDSFIEFIHFLNEHDQLKDMLDKSGIFVALEDTLNAWMPFRYSFMKAKMLGTYNAAQTLKNLDRLLILENECASRLACFISKLKNKGDLSSDIFEFELILNKE